MIAPATRAHLRSLASDREAFVVPVAAGEVHTQPNATGRYNYSAWGKWGYVACNSATPQQALADLVHEIRTRSGIDV